MQDYISLRIIPTPFNEDIADLVAACLGEVGFESFTSDDEGITAYIKVEDYDEEKAKEALRDFPIATDFQLESGFVKGEDWNEEWEKNYFKPIVVGERCVVHSSFHTDIPEVEYDIVVDPKMAFGTGHHSTTANMMTLILESDLKDKGVIDMGTGTGILAILAAMKGAKPVVGIEIDPYAWENAVENVKLNGVEAEMICGDASVLDRLQAADYFFANINRNVITADIGKYVQALKEGGRMFLSGFYKGEDVEIIKEAAEAHGLRMEREMEDGGWAAVQLVKTINI